MARLIEVRDRDGSRYRSRAGKKYFVHCYEPGLPPTSELMNLDSIEFEPPPCPLCDSAYSHVMAHHGPSVAWLSCYLGHCVKVYEDHAEVTDKPRYVLTMVMDMVWTRLDGGPQG